LKKLDRDNELPTPSRNLEVFAFESILKRDKMLTAKKLLYKWMYFPCPLCQHCCLCLYIMLCSMPCVHVSLEMSGYRQFSYCAYHVCVSFLCSHVV
jgi:hypothetical protein